MGHHWGHHRRLAPTIDIFASFGLRRADDGAEATATPPAEGATDVVVAAPQTPPRASRASGVGAWVRDGLTRLLAVNF